MKTILEIEEDHFQTEETQRAVAQFFSGQKLITESESYGAECPIQINMLRFSLSDESHPGVCQCVSPMLRCLWLPDIRVQ